MFSMSIKTFLKKNVVGSQNKFVNTVGKCMYKWFSDSKLVYSIRFCPDMDDEKYIVRKYKRIFHTAPNLVSPQNFNEKNNWRKLHDHRNIYTSMVDKYKLKEIVCEKCGKGYTFPLIGVWDKPQDIDFSTLPDQFVLKVSDCM